MKQDLSCVCRLPQPAGGLKAFEPEATSGGPPAGEMSELQKSVREAARKTNRIMRERNKRLLEEAREEDRQRLREAKEAAPESGAKAARRKQAQLQRATPLEEPPLKRCRSKTGLGLPDPHAGENPEAPATTSTAAPVQVVEVEPEEKPKVNGKESSPERASPPLGSANKAETEGDKSKAKPAKAKAKAKTKCVEPEDKDPAAAKSKAKPKQAKQKDDQQTAEVEPTPKAEPKAKARSRAKAKAKAEATPPEDVEKETLPAETPTDAVQAALLRADTQDIEAAQETQANKDAARKKYKARKERFYRSMKSPGLGFIKTILRCSGVNTPQEIKKKYNCVSQKMLSIYILLRRGSRDAGQRLGGVVEMQREVGAVVMGYVPEAAFLVREDGMPAMDDP